MTTSTITSGSRPVCALTEYPEDVLEALISEQSRRHRAIGRLRSLAVPAPPMAGPQQLQVPHNGWWPVSQFYGENVEWYWLNLGMRRGHNGLDFAIWNGTEIRSVQAGVVREAGYDARGYGWYCKVVVDDPEWPQHTDHEWVWAHGAEAHNGQGGLRVAQGDRVAAGDLLMFSNNSGLSSGPHTHCGHRSTPYDRQDGMYGYDDPLPILLTLNAGAVQHEPTYDERCIGIFSEYERQLEMLREEVLARTGDVQATQEALRAMTLDRHYNFNKMLALEGHLRYLEGKRRVKRGTTDALLASIPYPSGT